MTRDAEQPNRYEKLGLTLAQATERQARSQSWVAVLVGVSQATISKWFSGEQRPSLFHLTELARQFNLNEQEVATLAEYPPEQIKQHYANRYMTVADLDYWRTEAELIYRVRIRADPQLTIDMADNASSQLTRIERQIEDTKLYPELQKIHARILSEKAIAIRETCTKDEVLARTLPLATTIGEIGDRHDDDYTRMLAEAAITDAHYIYGTRNTAIEHAVLGIAIAEGIREYDNRLLMYRSSLVSLALSGGEEEFERQAKKVRNLINAEVCSHAEIACTTLEGMSTSQGILKLEATFETFELAQQFLKRAQQESGHLPDFRYLQIARSGLQSAIHLQTSDTSEFERAALEALDIAKKKNYSRYIDQLAALLQKLK